MSTRKDGKLATRAAPPTGSQTLLRGLDVLEAATEASVSITELATRLKLTRSTAHRLASALVERNYLSFTPREGYRLGPKLLELGYRARQQVILTRVVHPHLEVLSQQTGHTVHLGIMQGRKALYLDKVAGRRPIEISSHVGDLHAITSTGLGRALALDEDEASWREMWVSERSANVHGAGFSAWLKRMKQYVADGYTFDLEENERGIRCVGAPIRDSAGHIMAAISMSGATQYMSDAHMRDLAKILLSVVEAVSRELGWNPW